MTPVDQPNNPTPSHATIVLTVTADGEPASSIEQAAAILRAGGLVAFPTETVYGLGADATNPAAVERIFRAKGRPHSDPLIVHIAEPEDLPRVARDLPATAQALAARFWPGPLTLVVPRGAHIPALVAAGGDTVGVRVPASQVARALIRAAGVPVAAPSANRFMHTSPTAAAHVLADLDGRIDCVLDGGPSAVGVESTVLDLTESPPRVLRPGGVTLEALRAVLPDVEGPAPSPTTGGVARAPGQLERHYAPHTRLIVFDAQGSPALDAMRATAKAAHQAGERVGALLATGEAGALRDVLDVIEPLGEGIEDISRHLYAGLRTLDAAGVDVILSHTFGTDGLALAVTDRLRRAAGGMLTAV
ncbi:MAG TPA: L-threonylcarbamoyladenylate synthase [Ktedonobacterales bacterium]